MKLSLSYTTYSSLSVYEESLKQGCQMAIARFLDRMCLALRASGLGLRYTTLQNLIPSFPWIAPQYPPPCTLAQSKERKGSAILQPCLEVELHDQLRVVALSPTPAVRSVLQRYLIPLGINSIDFLSLIYEK